MLRRVLIRTIAFMGLSVLSITAYANSFPQGSSDIGQVQRIEEKASEISGMTGEISQEPIVIATPYSEPADELKNQSLIMSMDWDEEEGYLLAKIAMAEAEGEDTEGKALVMLVVLNRVLGDNEFPDTIEEVIYQPGQFSPISNGRFDRVEPDADCWAALDLIMLDKWDESCGAIYFESKSESTWHSENLDFLFQHGSHYFYRDRE